MANTRDLLTVDVVTVDIFVTAVTLQLSRGDPRPGFPLRGHDQPRVLTQALVELRAHAASQVRAAHRAAGRHR